jgi:phage tail-like protein
MASSSLTTFNSSIATDPLRSFRFNAVFQMASGNPKDAFDKRIIDSSSAQASLPSGASSGWQGGFTNVSGLRVDTQSITYREGGYNTTVHQIPGMTTFQPITFTRGVMYGNDQAMTWMRGLFAASAGAGLNPSTAGGAIGDFRVNITLTVNDHPNTDPAHDKPKMQFKIYNAWITGLNYSDLDATNGAILFETMTVTHEGLAVGFVTKAAGVTKAVVNPTGTGGAGGGARGSAIAE